MQESQILSTPAGSANTSADSPPSPVQRQPVWVFDACRIGVALRAILGMEIVLALVAMYRQQGWQDWLIHTAWLTCGGLPGTLIWLLTACSLKRVLQRLPPSGQFATGIALGIGGGLYASAMLGLASGDMAGRPWLANALAGGLMAAILVGGLRLRAAGRAPAAAAAQLAMLQARIQPHFLFNSLNSSMTLLREDPVRAERLLHDLSDLFRAALHRQDATVPLEEEIKLAHGYLAIEQIRFGDRLQVSWNLDPDAGRVAVPPLILQPLVENAVKHGVEPSICGAKVTISTQITPQKFVLLRVTNTLDSPSSLHPQPAASSGHGMALANVERRLRLLYDMQTQFSAKTVEHGFEVRISVPMS